MPLPENPSFWTTQGDLNGKPSSNLEALEKYTFELRVTGIFSTSRGYPMSLISTVTFAKINFPKFDLHYKAESAMNSWYLYD